MEIACKYEVEAITKRIIKHIDADWPKTLEEWDKSDALFKVPDRDDDDSTHWRFTNRRNQLTTVFPEPVAAINFAKKFKLHDILTAAFMELLRTPYHEDWNRYNPRQEEDCNRHWRISCVRWNILSSEDHTLLGILREKLKDATSFYFDSNFNNVPYDDCTNKKHDKKVLTECRDYLQLQFSFAHASDFLRWSREYSRGSRKIDRQRKFVVCRFCNDHIDSALERVRTYTWDYASKISESMYASKSCYADLPSVKPGINL